jgi:hypothetical protein
MPCFRIDTYSGLRKEESQQQSNIERSNWQLKHWRRRMDTIGNSEYMTDGLMEAMEDLLRQQGT